MGFFQQVGATPSAGPDGTVKAVRIDGYGTPPVVEDVPNPVAGPGRVVVETAGAALNPLDLKIAAGYMTDFFPVELPYTLGTDVSGTIAAVGPGVTGRRVGDRVVARLDPSTGGAFAERVAVPADQLVTVPDSIPLFLAPGTATAAATAWQALLEIADVRPGQRVLVHGGTGGVGGFAVQFARRLGAHVITTVSSGAVALAEELGADDVVDHATGDFGAVVSGIDVVIDTVGTPAVAERSLDVLQPGGLYIAVPAPPDAERAAARGLRAEFVVHASDPTRLATVLGLIADGGRIPLDSTLPLGQGPDALRRLAEGHARGKIILTR